MYLVQSGIFRKYFNDALKNNGTSKQDSNGFRELKITDYLGHVAVLSGGVTVSGIVFVCEFCLYRRRATNDPQEDPRLRESRFRKIDDRTPMSFQYREEFVLLHPTQLDQWREFSGYRHKFA